MLIFDNDDVGIVIFIVQGVVVVGQESEDLKFQNKKFPWCYWKWLSRKSDPSVDDGSTERINNKIKKNKNIQ